MLGGIGMNLETFLKNYINELLDGSNFSLEYAYSQIPRVPRLRPPVMLLLSIARNSIPFHLAEEDKMELANFNPTLPEYSKLLNSYHYYSTKDTQRTLLLQSMKHAVRTQMRLKNVTASQVATLIKVDHSMKYFTIQEYNRALYILKSM
jgi:hypothetical protein